MPRITWFLVALLFVQIVNGQHVLVVGEDSLRIKTNPFILRNVPDSVQNKLPCWLDCYPNDYASHWLVDGECLYLTALTSCSEKNRQRMPLAQAFGDRVENNRVLADWFAGELVTATGTLVHAVYEEPVYDVETAYRFEKGRFVGQTVYDNSKTCVSAYENPKLLIPFIHSQIQWEQLPELDTEPPIRVMLSITTNKQGQRIRLFNYEGTVWGNEAIRVVSLLLPYWSVYYRQGEVLGHAYNIPVVFSEENRIKYATDR
ncbi:MAG: hypothetical protein EAZ91_09725 [Cytophagales bacterium]|nr:MAG: hypothetical protein EAZ91_09725 [Cytophagales bacterium]